jgi:DNA helicase II / ATP-dependent DNA helicase PcrA
MGTVILAVIIFMVIKKMVSPSKREKLHRLYSNKNSQYVYRISGSPCTNTKICNSNRDVIPSTTKFSAPKITNEVESKIRKLQKISAGIEKKFQRENTDYVLNERYKVDYKSELNQAQISAATTVDGPLLIIAGAGSGKTKTLSYRVAFMMESGISPENILLLTFTRKASKEMLDRTKKLLKERNINSISGGTFHSFANLLLRQYSKFLNINPNFTILDTTDSEDVIDLVKKELTFEKKDKTFPRKKLIFKIISKSRNCGISIKDIIEREYSGIKEFIDDIISIEKNYQKHKNEHNQYDYDDLLEQLYTYLCENNKFKDLIQEKYKYILVDEFQDTNNMQKNIVDTIASKYKNIMVVGDDSQSIYSFRGANFENILLFPETYPNCKVIKLEQNYRSRQNILDFTNEIVKNFTLGYKKKLFSNNNISGLPKVLRFYDGEKEAEWIVNKIIELQEKQVSLNNIAVLYRATYHSNYIQAELIKRNMPFVVYGGIKFIERRHIRDIIAYLRIIQNVFDAVSWNRILTILTAIGDLTAKKIIQSIEYNKGIIDFSEFKGKKFYNDITKLETALAENSNPQVSVVEKIKSLKEYYTPVLKSAENDYEVRLQDIDVLITLATKYNELEKFLSDFALEPPSNKVQDSVVPIVDDVDDKLILSTIHSAKGLEWNYVFIPHTLDGLFPSAKALSNIETLDEERRMFYVATTRPRDELYISMPSMFASYGAVFTKPSRFIAEIEKNKYEYILGEDS